MQLTITKKQGRRLLDLLENSWAYRREDVPRISFSKARRRAQRRMREDQPLVQALEKALAHKAHVHRWKFKCAGAKHGRCACGEGIIRPRTVRQQIRRR